MSRFLVIARSTGGRVGLVVGVIVAVVLGLAAPAFTCNAIVTDTINCSTGSQVITWTITSDTFLPMTVSHVLANIDGSPVPVVGWAGSVPAGGSTTATSTVPLGVTGTILLNVYTSWPTNPVTTNVSGGQATLNNCTAPAPTSTTTTTTYPTTTTTSTTTSTSTTTTTMPAGGPTTTTTYPTTTTTTYPTTTTTTYPTTTTTTYPTTTTTTYAHTTTTYSHTPPTYTEQCNVSHGAKSHWDTPTTYPQKCDNHHPPSHPSRCKAGWGYGSKSNCKNVSSKLGKAFGVKLTVATHPISSDGPVAVLLAALAAMVLLAVTPRRRRNRTK